MEIRKSNSINNISEKILSFLKSSKDAVTQEQLTSAIPFQEALIAESLNDLIENNRISLIESSEGMLFKYRTEKEALKFRDLTKEEIAVYEVVMQSGSNGISTIDIKIKLKIDNTTYINKILTKLSKKFLIKSLKVLNTRNKKVWIGIDIEPSKEITGGIWCQNQDYNDDFISTVCEKCFEYIGTQKQISRKELFYFAKSTELFKKQGELKEEDLQKILNILIFDGKIEPIFPANIDARFLGNKYTLLLEINHPDIENVRYKKINTFNNNNIYEFLPCFVCPSFNECKESNVVTPLECPYNKALFNHNDE